MAKRTRPTPPTPEELAEQAALADRELLERLQKKADEEPTPPNPLHAINDVFVAMVAQLRDTKVQLARERTPLTEPTLVKLMETSLQFVAWDYQRRLQAASNPFAQFAAEQDGPTDPLVGPEPDEVIGPADLDDPVDADFTEEEQDA